MYNNIWAIYDLDLKDNYLKGNVKKNSNTFLGGTKIKVLKMFHILEL